MTIAVSGLRRTPGRAKPGPLKVLTLKVTELEQRIAVLEARNGPRDAADAAVLPAIAASIGAASFTSVQLLAHARVDESLAGALDGADITNARELGKLFARLETQTIGGLRLQRPGTGRDGIIWRVVVVRV